MIAFTSFLELFGIRQLATQPLAAGAAGPAVPAHRFYSSLTPSGSTRAPSGVQSPARRQPERAKNAPAPAPEPRAYPLLPHSIRHRVILPIDRINQGTLTALRYARSLSNDVTAVHVSMDAAETGQLQKDWPAWGEGVRLVVLESPHNMVLEPLLLYIQSIMALKQENDVITVVVPQYIHPRWWSNLARTQMAVLLRLALPFQTGIVITDVPYALEGDGD